MSSIQNFSTQQQGAVSIYLAVVVTALILGIGLGINTLLIGELQILRGVGYSVIAFEAADAGIEHILYIDKSVPCNGDAPCLDFNNPGQVSLGNGASYTITIQDDGTGTCSGANYCAQSTGKFKGAVRRVEITR